MIAYLIKKPILHQGNQASLYEEFQELGELVEHAGALKTTTMIDFRRLLGKRLLSVT